MLFISEESTLYADTGVIHRHLKTKWSIDGRIYTVSSLEKKEIVTKDGFPTVFGQTNIFEHGDQNAKISYSNDNEIFLIPVFVDSVGQQGMLLKELKQKD